MRTVNLARVMVAVALALLKSETIIADGKLIGLENNVVSVQTAMGVYKGLAAPKTRFWIEGTAAELKSFRIGQIVRARLKSDKSGVELRELADEYSALLLEKIRTTYVHAAVTRVDSQGYWFEVDPGKEHFYKLTKSSKIDRGTLKPGDKVWVRGRMLTSLDTSLVHASEQAPPPSLAPPSPGTKPVLPSAPEVPIDHPDGVPCRIVSLFGQMTMFDVLYGGRTYHILFDKYTLFLEGKRQIPFNDSWYNQNVRLKVRRDRYQRLFAIRVVR